MQRSANIARLLLVAGPTGAGKSTFIEAMKKGELPPDLASLLPGDWHLTDAKYVERGSDVPRGAPVLLHYDTTRPIRLGFCAFERDDALINLLSRAKHITAVTITVNSRRLLRQYVTRERAFKRFLMATGLDRSRGRRNRLPLIPFYKEPEWIEALDRSWKIFLSGLPTINTVTIMPEPAPFKFQAED